MKLQKAFLSKPKARPEAIVSGKNYRFQILTEGLLRYEWAEDGQFEDRASTFAINRDFSVPKFQLLEKEDVIEIITSRFHLTYDRKKFSPSGFTVDVKGKHTLWGDFWRYGKFGGTLGGTARTLDEADGRIPVGPGVISRHGYAAVDDRKSMLFDSNGWVAGRNAGHRDDGYVFAYGHDYKEAINAFYALSGKQPVIPRWALGNWWSRYHPYSADEYLSLMEKFEKEEIPLSVAVVDMDWHLVRDERVTHAGWTGYTFDTKLFPDPGAFGREMHKKNLKITLNDHPHGGVHAFEDCYEEMAKALNHDTSHGNPILWDPTNEEFMSAFFNIAHRNVEKDACDFWWIDWQQGEHSRIPGVDPLWMLNHFQYLDTGRNGDRSIVFSRYGGPGSHRYPVGFSGDTITSWASLDFQPEFTATASNVGYGWWSHDIGGHMGGTRDDELVARWIQFGIFSPLMRLHSTMSVWQSKEPWLFRKETHDVMTQCLRLRHRLIPYLYTMNVRAAEENEPIVQPMYWAYPERDEAYKTLNQYDFGSELLVTPITTPRHDDTHLASVRAWFPPRGRHVDIFTGIVYDGNRMFTLYRSIDEFPVFAAEGSIIPLDAHLTPKNGGVNPEAFEVLVAVGKDAEFNLIEDSEDDSKKHTSAKSETRVWKLKYDQKDGVLSAKGTRAAWTFRFLAFAPKDLGSIKVLVDGKASKDVKLELSVEPPSLLVKVPKHSGDHTVEVHLGKNPQLGIFDTKSRLFEVILNYQVDFTIKDQLWAVIDPDFVPLGSKNDSSVANSTLGIRVGHLMALGLDEALVGPVLELLLADSRTAN